MVGIFCFYGTKLDGIEASADATDTTNVTAAGAPWTARLRLAQVKAFDSSDYATAAQGHALQTRPCLKLAAQ